VRRGQVDRVSPRIGDVHVVANEGGEVAVSIHVYGANIGAVRRHTYDAASGARRDFVSGYANASIPNLWDRSGEA
jgi:predicted metal-dependent enzyme (double-stranded beta helix superfamily)